jgi:hypothetical protein
MRKPWKLAVIAPGIFLLGALAWKVFRTHEPIYEGRKLSSWLETYDWKPYPPNDLDVRKADAAVRHLGTNAILTLLKMLRTTDPRWKLQLYGLVQKQRFIKIAYISAPFRHNEATRAFNCLGARAESAVLPLVEIYDAGISPSSQTATAYSLGSIGPTAKLAIPSLLRGATNANPDVRASAIIALGQIHADPFLIMPTFLKARRDSNKSVNDAARRLIDTYEKEATRSVGALFESLQDADEKVRRQATNSLKEIYPEASANAGIK